MAKKKNGVLKLAVGIGAAALQERLHTIRLRRPRASLQRKKMTAQSLKYASTMLYVRTEWLRLRMRSLWDVRLRL